MDGRSSRKTSMEYATGNLEFASVFSAGGLVIGRKNTS